MNLGKSNIPKTISVLKDFTFLANISFVIQRPSLEISRSNVDLGKSKKEIKLLVFVINATLATFEDASFTQIYQN